MDRLALLLPELICASGMFVKNNLQVPNIRRMSD
jgi:hypothetical protein